jgi:pimeloyl-ACP methyl ester carboxylesterase
MKTTNKRSLQYLVLVALAFLFYASQLQAQEKGKNPVIIIPGVTGSQLVNPRTGKTVWFSVRRDKDDDVRLPMTSAIFARDRDTLQSPDIIRSVELRLLPDIEVYQTVIDALEAKGYKEADWKHPQATDVFYVFPYDWRRDNVETAHLLMTKMAAVRRSLRKPDLKFDVLAHSMGGLIARYTAMYGMSDLPPEGKAPVPNWSGAAYFNKLMMFGTPNQGSLSAFQSLVEGYPIIANRKLPFIDDFRPEDVLSTPSAYQLLPHRSSVRFLDENLQPINVDIYDPETWMKYGWGALSDPKFLAKLKDAGRLAATNPDIKPAQLQKGANQDDRIIAQTTYEQVRAFFAAALGRAKRFNAALDAAETKTPLQLYAYGGNCAPTLDAVVLLRDDKKNKWATLFDARDIKTSTGADHKKEELKAAMYALGDGRVTQRSLLAVNEAPKATDASLVGLFPLKSSFFGCGTHTKLFLDKPIQDSFLSALVVEKGKQP